MFRNLDTQSFPPTSDRHLFPPPIREEWHDYPALGYPRGDFTLPKLTLRSELKRSMCI